MAEINIGDTRRYRTRQEFKEKVNPKGKDYVMGLDLGYSGVKAFYETGYFCFPSYVKKLEMEPNVASEDDILYRDLDSGTLYMVGRSAQKMVSNMDDNDMDSEMSTRKWFLKEHFKVIFNAAMALMLNRKKDERLPRLVTGLPSSYLAADKKEFEKALRKSARFELKKGISTWKTFELSMDNIPISFIAQPAGAMTSALVKNNGEYVADAMQYLFKNILVIDFGYVTMDFYGVKNRTPVCMVSKQEMGMHEILRRTSKRILEEYGEDIRVQALQNNLESGKIIHVNEETLRSEKYALAPILVEENEKVFKEAMQAAKEVTNAFREYDCVIIGGGIGEAWFGKIKEYLSGLEDLKVISANRNCSELPLLYTIARGYYMTGLFEGQMKRE